MRWIVLMLLGSGCAEPPVGLERRAWPIVNGTRSPQTVPMTPEQQLAVGFVHGPNSPEAPFCTGTLIAPEFVITAAHCLGDRGPTSTGFGLGADPAEPEALLPVQALYTHRELDLAMLRLEAPAAAVVPIAANEADLDGPFGERLRGSVVEAAGFGETLDPERVGLWFVELTLVDIEARFVVVDGGGERGICRGDSGGPALAISELGAPVVLGVEHGGDESCVGRDQLTRLDVAAEWIAGVQAGTVAADGAPPGCGDLNFEGRCDGDTIRWCDEDEVPVARSCAAEGARCGWAGEDLGFYCLATPPDCAEIGDGVCLDGRVRRFCLGDEFVDDDCAAAGLRCASIEDVGAHCVDEEGAPSVPTRKLRGGGCCRVLDERAGATATGVLLLLLISARPRRGRGAGRPRASGGENGSRGPRGGRGAPGRRRAA